MQILLVSRFVSFCSIASAVGTLIINAYLSLQAHADLVLLSHDANFIPAEMVANKRAFPLLAVKATVLTGVLALIQLMASIYLLYAVTNQDAVHKGRKWTILSSGLICVPLMFICVGFTLFTRGLESGSLDYDFMIKYYLSVLSIIAVHFVGVLIMYSQVRNLTNVKYQFIDAEV